MIRKNQNGFTVIEILISVVIVAILSIASIYAYQLYIEEARASEVIPIIKGIQNAQIDYYEEHGIWPKDLDEIPLQIDGQKKIMVLNGTRVSGKYEGKSTYIFTDNFAYAIKMNGYKNPSTGKITRYPCIAFGRVQKKEDGGHLTFYSVEFEINRDKLRSAGSLTYEFPSGANPFSYSIKKRMMSDLIKKLTGKNFNL